MRRGSTPAAAMSGPKLPSSNGDIERHSYRRASMGSRRGRLAQPPPEQNKGRRPWRSKAPHSEPSLIDGKTYEEDVIIRLSGEVVKRKKKLSKKYYGAWHVLSKDEAKFVFEKGCEQIILALGPDGQCPSIVGS